MMKSFAWAKLKAKHLSIWLLAKYNIRNGVFAVDIRSSLGLGAKLEWCLEIMAYCDMKGLTPRFKFSYPNSEDSDDYFSSFFRIKSATNRAKPIRFIRIYSITELDLGEDYNNMLNFELASYLIKKYLTIREHVMNEVESFCCQYFGNRRVLGVHYRGTDKMEESSIISYDSMKRNIQYYLDLFPETDCIFVASDDMNFIEYMEKASIGCPVIYRNDSFRSRDGRPVHRSVHTDKYKMNRDAIVNCLILSKCDALLKTASILSAWSKLFNPQLPVVMLNRPYDAYRWFPERELMEKNLFEPIE
jgi:hypothetical protein